MNEPLTLAVPCFGTSPKWVRMVEVWLAYYLKSGCQLPVIVLTDMTTEIPASILPPGGNVTCLRFSTPVLRQGHPFDVQGALICQAARFLGPLVVMDSDALMLRDPTAEFARLPASARIGMAPDAGGAPFVLNAGVIYFGEATPLEREQLVHAYNDTFTQMLDGHADNPLLTQLVWSALWHRAADEGRAYAMPARLNHSRLWPLHPGVIIRHHHGTDKWQTLEIPAHAR